MLKKTSYFIFSVFAFAYSCGAYTQEDTEPVRVVEPESNTDSAHAAALDTERFELGAYTGLLSVEDFNTNSILGLSAIYHLNSRWFAQLNYATSSVSRATFEDVVGGNFLANNDRKFSYLSISAAYQLMQGRSYFRTSGKYNSGIYVIGGAGSVDFAGDENPSMVVGLSYRIIRTDWLSLNMDFRSHIVKREFIGDNKQTFNNELTVGVNYFF